MSQAMTLKPAAKLPLALKVFMTLSVLAYVPVLYKYLGFENALWFCDVALLIGTIGVWLESSFLCSMSMVSIVVVQIVWIADYFFKLATGSFLVGVSGYMFNTNILVHVVQLYHVWFPFVILWIVGVLGYHRRAWLAQFVVGWIVLLLARFWADPRRNIDASHYPGPAYTEHPEDWLPSWLHPYVYFVLLGVGLTVGVYGTTHLIAMKVYAKPKFLRRAFRAVKARLMGSPAEMARTPSK
jgi:hypothetical protein